MRHGIKIDMKGWLIGLIGAGAAVIGLGIWILANAISPEINKTVKASGIEPMGIASGAIVFLWQLAMGIILQKARVEHPVAEKIESIGDD